VSGCWLLGLGGHLLGRRVQRPLEDVSQPLLGAVLYLDLALVRLPGAVAPANRHGKETFDRLRVRLTVLAGAR
jgi:hypothetical protein